MPVIDADAHVIETDRTWEYLDVVERKLAPTAVAQAEGGRYWLIDGRVRPRDGNVSELFPRESRELLDVRARLRHMARTTSSSARTTAMPIRTWR